MPRNVSVAFHTAPLSQAKRPSASSFVDLDIHREASGIVYGAKQPIASRFLGSEQGWTPAEQRGNVPGLNGSGPDAFSAQEFGTSSVARPPLTTRSGKPSVFRAKCRSR